jgi:putative polyhydroxyalkanoate system protein
MPRISIQTPHALATEEAKKRVETLLEKVKHRYQSQVSDLQEAWDGDNLGFQFTTYGFKIKGKLDVRPDQVNIDGEIPFAAMMFKGRIEQTIRDELAKLLA